MTTHDYDVTLEWTGNLGRGTADYRAYARNYTCHAKDKPVIEGSADPHFRGDPACWNPEELLVASLSACHQLWYLHLCADAGVVVLGYRDSAHGRMIEHADGSGEFTRVTLRPVVTIALESDAQLARSLHARAAQHCFIARSMAFPVEHVVEIISQSA